MWREVFKVLLAIVTLLFIAWTATTCEVQAAELVTQTEKTELWGHVDYVEGKKVICYWVQNRKGMADNVSTGLACVLLDRQYVVVEKVMEPHVHGNEPLF
jgi:hypothetical protein